MPEDSGSPLQLRDEGASGWRHYLAGRMVSFGDQLELHTDDGWKRGSYEWAANPKHAPVLVLGQVAITLGDSHLLRWPSSD